MDRYQPVKCPACNKLLFERRRGGEQRIVCRCKRLLTIDAQGTVHVERDVAAAR